MHHDGVMNPDGSAEIEIAVPLATVWAAISDIERHPEWSSECVAAEWTGGHSRPEVGATFVGHNAVGDFTWDAPCTVTDATKGSVFSYLVGDPAVPSAMWRWELEAIDHQTTRVRHSFHAPDLLKPDYPYPGRDEMLLDGIVATLGRVKQVLEGTSSEG